MCVLLQLKRAPTQPDLDTLYSCLRLALEKSASAGLFALAADFLFAVVAYLFSDIQHRL